MESLIEKAIYSIQELENQVPAGKHIVTGDIRKLSAGLFRQITNRDTETVIPLCEQLLERHSWPLGVIAFDWAYRMREQYTENTYDVFYHWLKDYVRGWGDCDDFCTHAFGALLRKYKSLFQNITEWTMDEDFWVRRASAVILIPAILHNDYEGLSPLIISDSLMADEHDLVQKGYGWMLKCLSQIDAPLVKDYLISNHSRMPRTAYRYALEKFDKATRTELMNLPLSKKDGLKPMITASSFGREHDEEK